MGRKKKEHSVFSDLIGFVVNGSLLIAFGVLLMLIYLPFSNSIDSIFEPDPEPLTGPFPSSPVIEIDENAVVKGIHLATGMAYDQNFEIVRAACTSCHSAKLITQNRATREGWKQMIKWMQATQGLPDLGKNEPIILNYLAKHYAPTKTGQRKNLNIDEIEWYALTLE